MRKSLVFDKIISRENKDLQELGTILMDELTKSNRPASFITKKTFSPSSVGGYNGSCPRFWNMAFKGGQFEYGTDPLSVNIMANGTAAHARLQTAYEKAGVLLEAEREITYQDPPIRGFVDAIFDLHGEKIVGEFKTTNSTAFEFRKTSQKPSDQHRLQILIYLKALGIKRGAVIYENRDTLELLILPVVMDQENEDWLEEVFGWMREVYKSYTDNKTVKAPFQKRNKICQECPLYTACWKDPSFDIEIAKIELKNI